MDGAFDDSFMMALLQDLSHIGDVILVRFVGETIWVTFRDGQCALAAARRGQTQVCGHTLKLTLKSPNWLQLIEKEIEICSNTTVPQCDENSPARSPVQGFDQLEIGGGGETSSGRASPNSGLPPPPRPPAPPGRPSQPPRSPARERRPLPRAGVISVLPNQFNTATNIPRESPSEETEEARRLSPESAIYEEILDESPLYPAPSRPPPPLPRPPDVPQDSPSRPPTSAPPPLPHRQAPPLPPPQHPPPSLPPPNMPPPVPARTTGGPPIPARNQT